MGGTVEFGKLTMHNTDLFVIDTSQHEWFEFDLANYQQQLVNGYLRLTPTAGLQIYLPDISTSRHEPLLSTCNGVIRKSD